MTATWFEASPSNVAYGKGLARAFAGALIFALPMLMTMEMWWLGFHADPLKLALLLLLTVPLLVGLAHFGGFKETEGVRDYVIDAFVAIAVAFVCSAVVLLLFAILRPGMSGGEMIGKLVLQTVPASIGAMLARAQLGEEQVGNDSAFSQGSYPVELFTMAAGALFLAFNVAPTEEMVLLAFKMTIGHEIALALATLVLMHAFVYLVDFRGEEKPPESAGFWSVFLRFTLVGYVLALLIGLYILWTFGRTAATGLEEIVSATIVLGFPAGVGAAAARLIL